MPTKRRFILFLIVLAVMLLIRLARSQDGPTVGWDPAAVSYGDGIVREAVTAAAQDDRYFTGDLVTLTLRRPGPPATG
jgi:hypothetical protein